MSARMRTKPASHAMIESRLENERTDANYVKYECDISGKKTTVFHGGGWALEDIT